ncbi:hypothetical protein A9Q87_08330 [Flavobacteriales bacterium 34_180_T64]|nr:hypothetical protein A9Q87_08330 [Flavobacteriales bacterium 34_180_T64]
MKYYLVLLYFLFFFTNLSAQTFDIGHTTIDFYDSDRNRYIETEIYYPTDNPGENVPIEIGNFPVIVFGHGFLMDWGAYQNFWDELVPHGYVICFPTTEMSITPNHEDFGLDLKFIAAQMQNENLDNTSVFYNSLTPKTALIGHSMGGGAAFLAAENNLTISTLVNFASAETNPSAISVAINVTVPSLIFSGDDDCISPANTNQELMYTNLASECKTHINIINAGHCYFANTNFNCDFGESICNPSLNITREEQQQITFNFLNLWLDYTLNDNQDALISFNESLQDSTQINFSQNCNALNLEDLNIQSGFEMSPNPIIDELNLTIPLENIGGLFTIYNSVGQLIFQEIINNNIFQINLSSLSKGVYIIKYSKESLKLSSKFIKL